MRFTVCKNNNNYFNSRYIGQKITHKNVDDNGQKSGRSPFFPMWIIMFFETRMKKISYGCVSHRRGGRNMGPELLLAQGEGYVDGAGYGAAYHRVVADADDAASLTQG